MKQSSLCICGKEKRDIAVLCLECFTKINSRGLKTKGDYLKNMDNWWEARVPIAKHARIIFNKSNKEKKCFNCRYDKHIEVCHIKAVSEFSDESILNEINNIDNLVALCRNCHWEFDNGLLIL